ncbi:MAG: Pyruvate formate-lyase 1-activating enzyme [Bacteroidetes bacterium ADurb.Bin012]|nr:MAG: Pyruvate formate-lyase 1-activating enzyme [Bacteroidetes bacterium ADurb.Bin012]
MSLVEIRKYMQQALFYERLEDMKVKCLLCPHECLLSEGKIGVCRVRKNISGELYALNDGIISSANLDPIEKKPLYHFYPGSLIFSIGSYGCNMHCRFCQNWEISQPTDNIFSLRPIVPASEIIKAALNHKENIGIAYTYNEPIVSYEYVIKMATLAKEKGLKNVMVSNGFINQEPLLRILPLIDAWNIDLKAFDESFYKRLTGAQLAPVLETLKTVRKSKAHLEITTLVIPNENDEASKFKKMVNWLADELGEDTILHLSRYFPRYHHQSTITPAHKLVEFYNIARQRLYWTYVGNIELDIGNNSICPKCKNIVVWRKGYHTAAKGLDESGNCRFCKTSLPFVV